MPKYIDADSLYERLEKRYQQIVENHAEFDAQQYIMGFGEAINALKNEPEVDVEEVRHGKWIYRSYHPRMGHAFECSVCKRWMFTAFLKSVVEDYPYCHCGAKMESVEGLQEDENG